MFHYINHRDECYTLSKLQPQGASPTEDTDSSMAASVQLEQTSARHFGRVDSGSDRDTTGHSVCNSGWTSGTGGYERTVYLRLCTCCIADFLLRTTLESELSLKFGILIIIDNLVIDNSPKNQLNYSAAFPNKI